MIGKAKDAAEREARKDEGRQLREQVQSLQTEIERVAAELEAIHRQIPNLSHPDAPVGVDNKSNLELARGKTPLPTVRLSRRWTTWRWPRSWGWSISRPGPAWPATASISSKRSGPAGAGPAALRGDVLMSAGFTPITTPDLARNEVLAGIGFIPRGPETQIYSIENSDLSLVATAEITLGGMLAGETLEADALPKKFCGISHCFRTEAGPTARRPAGYSASTSSPRSRCSPSRCPSKATPTLEELRGLGVRAVRRAGPALSRGGHGHRRPGRAGLSQVRPGGLDARPRRVRRGDEHQQLHRLSSPAAEHPLPSERRKSTHFVHTLNGTAIAVSRA